MSISSACKVGFTARLQAEPYKVKRSSTVMAETSEVFEGYEGKASTELLVSLCKNLNSHESACSSPAKERPLL